MTIEWTLSRARLDLHYRFAGDPATLCLPAAQIPGPADGLWRRTCCEAFIAASETTAYDEYNFSPAGQWAAYRFTAYRQRDPAAPPPAALPPIEFRRRADGFDLRAAIPASLLPAGGPLRLGLSAVIERADGGMDYWALAHGGERPDFHQRQTFILELERP